MWDSEHRDGLIRMRCSGSDWEAIGDAIGKPPEECRREWDELRGSEARGWRTWLRRLREAMG